MSRCPYLLSLLSIPLVFSIEDPHRHGGPSDEHGKIAVERPTENRGKAVTISRQMGSGGTYIGYQVAKALGFSYVDREILRRAARILRRDTVSLEECEETSSGLIRNFLRELAFAPETTAYMPGERPVYDGDLFVLEGEIIKAMVDRHNAVIMGHGGFHLLKDRPGTVHLFIYAPRDYRVERVMKARGIAHVSEAQDMVDESDRRRSKFVKDMVGREWVDARNYHFCMDTSVLGLSESVRMVIRFLETTLA